MKKKIAKKKRKGEKIKVRKTLCVKEKLNEYNKKEKMKKDRALKRKKENINGGKEIRKRNEKERVKPRKKH